MATDHHPDEDDALIQTLVHTIGAGPGMVVPVIGPDLLQVEVSGRKVGLYAYVAEELARELNIKVEPLNGGGLSIDDVVGQYCAKGEPLYVMYPIVKKIMNTLEAEPPEALRQLARVRHFRLFVTTTFDSFMQQALDEVYAPPERAWEPYTPCVPYAHNQSNDLPVAIDELETPFVYQLFGAVTSRQNDYVLYDEDILEFMCSLQSHGKRPPNLFDALRQRHLLLIGHNFSDWLARFFLRTACCERPSDLRFMQFVVDKRMAQDHDFTMFLGRYSKRTKLVRTTPPEEFVERLCARYFEMYAEENEEATRTASGPAAERLLAEVRGDVEGRTKTPKTEPAKPKLGPVFISYASEDRQHAVNVHEALKEAGIAAWLDKNRLEGGMDYEDEIKRHIEGSKLFIPVLSKNTQQRGYRFFKKEWSWAIDKGAGFTDDEPFIIPISVDETQPDSPRLPEDFRRVQWNFLSQPDGLQQLASRVKVLCEELAAC